MGIGKLTTDNKEFLLDIIKKLELDKKLKEEGINIVEDRKAIKVAKNLLKMGLDIEQVATAAEISIEQVKKIKEQFID